MERKIIMEQRSIIKFHAKSGINATKTFESMKKVYGNLCLSRATVFDWHKRFREDRESLEDDEGKPKPRTTHNADTIKKVGDYLADDENASVRMISEDLHINRETVRLIITVDLGKRKICARFVPHHLTDDQKLKRVIHSKEMISFAANNPNFTKSIITADETWCFQYDPETKRQSATWKSPRKPKVQKTIKHHQKSKQC